jgi:5-deoxy-glucuronate isomerase
MKIQAKELKNGLTRYVTAKENKIMNMDFGVIRLGKGGVISNAEQQERILVLLSGKVKFTWVDGNGAEAEGEAQRGDVFHDDPVLLHVPAGVRIGAECLSDEAQLTLHATGNARDFEPKLLRAADLLSGSEMRGEGLMNDASTRIVRTYFDRSSCPETNFFVGEVVSFPGKWSSFPSHVHVTPEIYYYRFLPENGFGLSMDALGHDDNAKIVRDGDMMCFAPMHMHSQSTAPGYAEWYIWIIRLEEDKPMNTIEVDDYKWAGQQGAKYFPDI